MRLLSNGWMDFHQVFTKDVFAVLFINGGTPMKIGSPKNLGLKTSILERKFRLCHLQWVLCGNEEEFLEVYNNWYNCNI